MAEDPTTEQPPSVPDDKSSIRQVNPTKLLAAAVAAGILTIAMLTWAQGVRAAAVRREAFGRGIDGLTAALRIPLIEMHSARNENRGTRLQSVAEGIQRTGKYQTVVVTDPDGIVLATTDTSLRGQTVKEMAKAKVPSEVRDVDGLVEAVCAIQTEGGANLGAIKVRAKF